MNQEQAAGVRRRWSTLGWQGIVFAARQDWRIADKTGEWANGSISLKGEDESLLEVTWSSRGKHHAMPEQVLQPLRAGLRTKLENKGGEFQELEASGLLSDDSLRQALSLEGFGFAHGAFTGFVAFPWKGRLAHLLYHAPTETEGLDALPRILEPLRQEKARKDGWNLWSDRRLKVRIPRDYRLFKESAKEKQLEWRFKQGGEELSVILFEDAEKFLANKSARFFLERFLEPWRREYTLQMPDWASTASTHSGSGATAELLQGRIYRVTGVRKFSAFLAPPAVEVQIVRFDEGRRLLAGVQAFKQEKQCLDSVIDSARDLMGIEASTPVD